MLASLVLGVTLASALAPTVSVENASSVGFTTALVEGTIDPQGQSTSYRFEYATQEDFSDAVVGLEGTVGGASQPVGGELTNLTPDTTYHLRLVAENGDGPSEAVAAATFSTKAVAPPAVSIEPAGALTATGAHLSGHITPGGTDPAFNTSWRFECSPECPGLIGGEINPADESSHEVEADATGLEPNTPYTVTLYASNLGGEASAEVSFTTSAIAPSEVQTVAVHGPVADTSARLVGAVNSNNSPASYWFEYGPADCALNPCTSVPASQDGTVAPANQVQLVGQNVSGLQPETTYHYRLVVEAGLGGQQVGADQTITTSAPIPPPPSSCPNEAIRVEQGSTMLPDCRAWEQVSLADKSNSQVKLVELPEDGSEQILYSLFGGAPGSPSGVSATFLASRGQSGWSSANLLPPRSQMFANNYTVGASAPDFSSFIISAFNGFALSSDMTIGRLGADQGQSMLYNFAHQEGGSGALLDASDDLAHVLSPVRETIVPSHQAGTYNVYDFGSGTPVLVSAMPGTGLAPACGIATRNQGYALSGFLTDADGSITQHWIAADGSQALFVTADDNCSDPLELYLRDLGAETTSLISGPPIAGDSSYGIDLFLGATRDGGAAFFRTATSLDPKDDDDGNSADMDVYRWNRSSGQSDCITCVVPNAEVSRSNFPAVNAVVSEDGSRLYFTSPKRLADAPGAASAGAPNLYVWRSGQSGIHFIARVDGITNIPGSGGQATPDGRTLIFESAQPGLDTLSGSSNGGFTQAYRYDDRDQSVSCVSCPPDGAPASGEVGVLAGGLGRAVEGRNRTVSDDGSMVVFSTPVALVAGDINEALDVYEWRDGSPHLITSGKSDVILDPKIVGVTANGSDAYFIEARQLTWDAVEKSGKLYDARIGGGFVAPPSPSAPCEKDACHGQPAGPVPGQAAASATFSGPGNVRATHRKPRHHKPKHKKRHHKRAANSHRGGAK